jgi:hypothetical protein
VASYVCDAFDSVTGECVAWSEAFVLPSLTAEQGTEVLAIVIPVMIIAAALRIVRDFILKPRDN